MNWKLDLVVLLGVLFTLLLSGVWTAMALGAAGGLVIYLDGGTTSLGALGSIAWNTNSSYVLTAVPLFILMGHFILASGLSDGFFRGLDYWLRRVPGGLMPGSILACGVFAATNGSSVATAATVGTVALPEMTARNYDPKLAAGTIAAGGTLGILIPPSIPLILYASMQNQSVAELFAAALIPGLILTGLFILYVVIRTIVNPAVAGQTRDVVPLRERLLALPPMVPVFVLIGIVIGTIYTGVATPTESAALGALGALVMSLPRMTPRIFSSALVASVKTTVMVMAIMVGAQVLSFALVDTDASRQLTQAVIDLDLSKWALLGVVSILYIILGDFIDGISMMLLTLPLLYPIMVDAGFHPVVFAVMLVIFIELGQITPPVGLNLFVIHAIDPRIPHGHVIRGSLPFGGIMLVLVFALAAFPQLALWLAERAGG
jgi:tripartite ATP-independent transporter DctM subunit